MSEYDLKKSEKGIGQLYPILEAKDGEVIDGFHREEADKNWKRVRLEHIDTEEKKLVARLVANFHRRQITREDKEEWINGLARIYKKQGYKILDKFPFTNEIKQKIMDVTGLSDDVVKEYLLAEFKSESKGGWGPETPRLVPASQRIEKQLGSKVLERHREEVLAEEKPKIEQELRTKLVKEPTFQRQVLTEIRKAEPTNAVCEVLPPIEAETTEPMPSPTESTTKIVCPNCGYRFTIEEAKII